MKIERFVPARDASTAAQPEEKQGAGGAGLRFRDGLLAAFGLRGQNMPDAQPDSARGLVVAESTVVLLDKILAAAIKVGASDLHMEPEAECARIRLRLDGMMHGWFELPLVQYTSLLARIKVLAGLDIAERYRPQDGHFSFSQNDRTFHLRVAVMPTMYGEKAVLRLLSECPQLDYANQFGMEDAVYRTFLPLLDRPGGLIYFTGPIGAGKTTTLYLVLEELSRRGWSLATIEDPVERQIEGVSQTQINPAAGLTFETGLRALLRQDPDALMVGETRDTETARLSVRAAIAGHAVYSTLHTRSAIGAVSRLIDLGVEPYLLADALAALVAQRLLRKVCPACAVERPPTREEAQLLGPGVKQIRRGCGCTACHNTGYSGRVAIHELVLVDVPLREEIARRVTVQQMRVNLRKRQQLPSLRERAIDLVREGLTTPEEVLRTTEAE